MRLDVTRVSWNLFTARGVRPMLERAFTEQEDRPGVDVAVLRYGLWETRSEPTDRSSAARSRSIAGRTRLSA